MDYKKYIQSKQFFITKILYKYTRGKSIGKLKGEQYGKSTNINEALRTYMYRNQIRNSQKAMKNAEILESILE